jgi:hypothetical protein
MAVREVIARPVLKSVVEESAAPEAVSSGLFHGRL